MRRFLCILLALVLMAGCFLLGWRVMPKVWPYIKTTIVYRVFPSLEPEEEEEDLYYPEHNAELGDRISETDSLIYYFYKPYCPYCAALEPLLGGLPEYITLPDGSTSQVKLVVVDKLTDEGAALISAYYEAHAIPEDRQYVPAVVIGDQYLFPGREIIDGLLDALVAGEGLNTPLLDGSERIAVSPEIK